MALEGYLKRTWVNKNKTYTVNQWVLVRLAFVVVLFRQITFGTYWQMHIFLENSFFFPGANKQLANIHCSTVNQATSISRGKLSSSRCFENGRRLRWWGAKTFYTNICRWDRWISIEIFLVYKNLFIFDKKYYFESIKNYWFFIHRTNRGVSILRRTSQEKCKWLKFT